MVKFALIVQRVQHVAVEHSVSAHAHTLSKQKQCNAPHISVCLYRFRQTLRALPSKQQMRKYRVYEPQVLQERQEDKREVLLLQNKQFDANQNNAFIRKGICYNVSSNACYTCIKICAMMRFTTVTVYLEAFAFMHRNACE